MMPTVSPMALFHFLDQDDQKRMQHDLVSHVMPLVPESASSVAPLHLFSHEKNEAQHWHLCWHQKWHHCVP